MATVTVYRPSPVFLPEDAPVTRRFHDNRSHLPGKPALTDADYKGFETHVIFHDVFLSSDGLRAIGPPLVNLADVVLPITALLVDEQGRESAPLQHQLKLRDRATFHHFALPPSHRSVDVLRVRFILADGTAQEVMARRPSLAPVFLQFVTMQKNNPLPWIMDWLQYSADLGVERVVIYDNGSDGFDDLAAALESAPASLDIVLVDWPFAYGPVRSFYNQFSQPSQNNHTHQCFAAATWVGHFDIDEFLVNRDGLALRDRLAGLNSRIGCLRIDSHWVPYLEGTGSAEGTLPTVRDFPIREKEARGHAYKYVVRQSVLREAKIHNGLLKFGHFRIKPSPAKIVFLHYKGLTTGWKTYWDREERDVFDSNMHVEDSAVIDAFERLDSDLV